MSAMLWACWAPWTRLVSCSTEENCAICVTLCVGSWDELSGSWFCISATSSCRNPSWPRIAAGFDTDVVALVPVAPVVGGTELMYLLLCEDVDPRPGQGQLRRLDRDLGLVGGGIAAFTGRPHCTRHVSGALAVGVLPAGVPGEVDVEPVDGDALGLERSAQVRAGLDQLLGRLVVRRRGDRRDTVLVVAHCHLDVAEVLRVQGDPGDGLARAHGHPHGGAGD